jgi:hypothetical protein
MPPGSGRGGRTPRCRRTPRLRDPPLDAPGFRPARQGQPGGFAVAAFAVEPGLQRHVDGGIESHGVEAAEDRFRHVLRRGDATAADQRQLLARSSGDETLMGAQEQILDEAVSHPSVIVRDQMKCASPFAHERQQVRVHRHPRHDDRIREAFRQLGVALPAPAGELDHARSLRQARDERHLRRGHQRRDVRTGETQRQNVRDRQDGQRAEGAGGGGEDAAEGRRAERSRRRIEEEGNRQ